jgi:hypothetical protein
LPMSQLRSRASALSCGMGAPGAAVACGHGQAVQEASSVRWPGGGPSATMRPWVRPLRRPEAYCGSRRERAGLRGCLATPYTAGRRLDRSVPMSWEDVVRSMVLDRNVWWPHSLHTAEATGSNLSHPWPHPPDGMNRRAPSQPYPLPAGAAGVGRRLPGWTVALAGRAGQWLWRGGWWPLAPTRKSRSAPWSAWSTWST